MNSDFMFEIEGMMNSIDQSDAISIFFPTFRKALVVDPRSNDNDGPLVRIMPMAASPQERLRTLRRLRIGFPRIRNLAVIPWMRYVDSLVSLGLWERLISRLERAGEYDAIQECEKALDQLRDMERVELINAVTGKNYRTIWAAREWSE